MLMYQMYQCIMTLDIIVLSFQISCTSIMYATERKQTKIEFPESKILEETLNCTLYQNSSDNSDNQDPYSSYWEDSAPM